MTPGIYLDISSDAYHSGPGLSRSDLVKILRSPAHLQYSIDKEETAAMLLGEAMHLATLQPLLFEERYTALPADYDGRTAKGKAQKAEIEASGKNILKHEDLQAVKGMAKTIRAHPGMEQILSNGQPEVSVYWYDPLYPDILLKARLDWLNTKESIILDLKSTTDAREGHFTKHAYDMGYHLQAAHYLSGISIATKVEHRDFRFAVVEKTMPYATKLYQANQEMLQHGAIEIQKALRIYQECLEKNQWPAYPTEMEELGLPGWVKRQEPQVIYS